MCYNIYSKGQGKVQKTRKVKKMTTKRAYELISKDWTGKELCTLATEEEFVVATWGLPGFTIVQVCNAIKAPTMTYEEFLSHCTACGGDWGAMLLSGIKELYPLIWDLIPDNMGAYTFAVLSNVIRLLNVKEKGEV